MMASQDVAGGHGKDRGPSGYSRERAGGTSDVNVGVGQGLFRVHTMLNKGDG